MARLILYFCISCLIVVSGFRKISYYAFNRLNTNAKRPNSLLIVSLQKDYCRLFAFPNRQKQSGPREIVLDDFNQILEAIKIYGDYYNTLDIPVDFDVPAEDPWPVYLHGLRLGRRLERILSTEAFFTLHPDKVKLLQSIGFNPFVYKQVSSEDWPDVLLAFQSYKSLHGDARVPLRFVVPTNMEIWPPNTRGLPLGQIALDIRSTGKFVKHRPERREQLDLLDFDWKSESRGSSKRSAVEEAEQQDFEKLLQGLQVFKQYQGTSVEGDDDDTDALNVPATFVVPSSPAWPKNLHGFKLGREVRAAQEEEKYLTDKPDRIRALKELGLPLRTSSSAIDLDLLSQKRFDLIYLALQAYKQVHGNVDVPLSFVVPSYEPWPVDVWGLKLGLRVQAIRKHDSLVSRAPERRALLDALGFVWVSSNRSKKKLPEKERDANQPYDLFQDPTYLALLSYLGQDEEEDPLTILDREEAFEEEEEVLEPQELHTMQMDYRAFAANALMYGQRKRNEHADNRVRDISHFERLSLNHLDSVLSRPVEPAELSEMQALGYRYFEFDGYSWSEVVAALLAYKSTFGDLNVPSYFSLTASTLSAFPLFSEELFGLPLGQVVQALRWGDVDGFDDPDRRTLLDAMGFDWGDVTQHLHFRFSFLVHGLRIYQRVRGVSLVPEDFVVPCEPTWPVWMVGAPLGEWLALARIQQQTLRRHYPERFRLLDNFRPIWWLRPSYHTLDKYTHIFDKEVVY